MNNTLVHDWTLTAGALGGHQPDTGGPAITGVSVPWDARCALAAAGRTPDPRHGVNSRESDWVATRTWWLQRRVALPSVKSNERLFLHLGRSGDRCRAFVDGAPVGGTASFNREAWIDLNSHAGREVALDLAVDPVDPAFLTSRDVRPATRRHAGNLQAVMLPGGDHNPFLVNAGMIQPPEVVVADGCLVRGVGLTYRFRPRSAAVDGRVRLDLQAWAVCRVEIVIEPIDGNEPPCRLVAEVDPVDGTVEVPFGAFCVRRWQPWHHGEPACYRLTVTAGGRSVSMITGFREVAKVDDGAYCAQTPPSVLAWHSYENNGPYGQDRYKGYEAIRETGEAWPARPREADDWRCRHRINDRDLFIIGGAVVPPTLFWSEWSAEAQRRLVRRARESGHNTLRVWGGGILLDPAFYEECDRLGIMVHHDYLNFHEFETIDGAALAAREAEARTVARAVALHPCVVVLNGGNELHQNRNRSENPVFRMLERVSTQDAPQILWHRSSPVLPEVHGPWHFDLDHHARYASQRVPLNSECGCAAAPELESLRAMLPAADLARPLSDAWLHRAPDQGYFTLLRSYVQLFGPLGAADAAAVVARTQLIQALAYQVISEEHRRQQPAVCGFITWEFNEPWLDLNWGLIDQRLVAKAAFHVFRRANAPAAVSARLPAMVWAPGETFSAGIHLVCDPGLTVEATLEATVMDEAGSVLARQSFSGSSSSATALGDLTATVPERGTFTLALRGATTDGRDLRADYPCCVLPRGTARPARVLVLDGGCYEDAVIVRFLRAAGLDVIQREAGPDRPLADLDLTGVQVLVLGPLFNPLRSLSAAAWSAIDAAVRSGLGLVHAAYNTSAYVSGRYDVDVLANSALERLLPVTFPAGCWRNGDEGMVGGPLTALGDHPVWSGVDLAEAPDPGLGVLVVPRPGATVLARRGADPLLVEGVHGHGRVLVWTGPWGGHQYQECGFRAWNQAHRLLANLIEYAAHGSVVAGPGVPHPLAPLAALVAPRLTAAVTEDGPGRWTVTVANAGTGPAHLVRLRPGRPGSGTAFDWHPEDDAFGLLPGESRRIAVRAAPLAGQVLPAGLTPIATAWPAAE